VSIFTNATGTWLLKATNASISAFNNTPLLVTASGLAASAPFLWIAQVCDVAGNCAFYNANRTAIVDLAAPNISAENVVNNANFSSQSIVFNITVVDNILPWNVSIYHNASGVWHRNATNSTLIYAGVPGDPVQFLVTV